MFGWKVTFSNSDYPVLVIAENLERLVAVLKKQDATCYVKTIELVWTNDVLIDKD